MSIYKNMLGNDFASLHPMLQHRYDLSNGELFKATGIMKEIKGGPKWLFPIFKAGVKWKFLFPEHGKNIPFTIKNTAYVSSSGEHQIHWERTFHFGNKRRYFNALMSFDEKLRIIKDYLGEPALFYSDLAFTVTNEGFITIKSLNQRLVLGRIEIPLPRLFQGLATVTEKYDDTLGLYHISVIVKNPLIGTVFSYEGVFTEDD